MDYLMFAQCTNLFQKINLQGVNFINYTSIKLLIINKNDIRVKKIHVL